MSRFLIYTLSFFYKHTAYNQPYIDPEKTWKLKHILSILRKLKCSDQERKLISSFDYECKIAIIIRLLFL